MRREIEPVLIDGMPFLPIGAFRNFHVFNKSAPYKTFTSSGSTNEVAARHSFTEEGLALYQQLSTRHFRAFLASLNIGGVAPIVSFVPTPFEWPSSSLAAMIDMFKSAGLNVVYFDEQFRCEAEELVVFGTSFHHVLNAQGPNRLALADMTRGKRVTVIDTGGTKGKTRSYSLEEISEFIHATYSEAASCTVVSEYGMCELASQAWSLNAPHDGWFKANDSLDPLIVDLDERRVMSEDGEIGFLAFIDKANQDSYMAIVTEDLAVMNAKLPGCFKLVGRAPDASLKGCSLRVSKEFFPPLERPSVIASVAKQSIFPQLNYLDCFATLAMTAVEKLPTLIWDEHSKKDLLLSLKSLEKLPDNIARTRTDQRVLMVLSANIPITFLYPAFMCFLRGVKEVHLQLPSIRSNDPFSDRVRLQIKSLVEAIAPFVAPMNICLHDDKDISFAAYNEFDTVLVFGSDDTIQTFRAALDQVELIGLGSVANAVTIGPHEHPSAIGETCSRWLGRGCLTPVALINAHDEFVDEFMPAFDKALSARLQAANTSNRFFHRHRLLEFESQRVRRGQSTFVVDLRTAEVIPNTLSGGCGLLYLLSQEQFNAQTMLTTHIVDPGFLDPHMGKTWAQWL